MTCVRSWNFNYINAKRKPQILSRNKKNHEILYRSNHTLCLRLHVAFTQAFTIIIDEANVPVKYRISCTFSLYLAKVVVMSTIQISIFDRPRLKFVFLEFYGPLENSAARFRILRYFFLTSFGRDTFDVLGVRLLTVANPSRFLGDWQLPHKIYGLFVWKFKSFSYTFSIIQSILSSIITTTTTIWIFLVVIFPSSCVYKFGSAILFRIFKISIHLFDMIGNVFLKKKTIHYIELEIRLCKLDKASYECCHFLHVPNIVTVTHLCLKVYHTQAISIIMEIQVYVTHPNRIHSFNTKMQFPVYSLICNAHMVHSDTKQYIVVLLILFCIYYISLSRF